MQIQDKTSTNCKKTCFRCVRLLKYFWDYIYVRLNNDFSSEGLFLTILFLKMRLLYKISENCTVPSCCWKLSFRRSNMNMFGRQNCPKTFSMSSTKAQFIKNRFCTIFSIFVSKPHNWTQAYYFKKTLTYWKEVRSNHCTHLLGVN